MMAPPSKVLHPMAPQAQGGPSGSRAAGGPSAEHDLGRRLPRGRVLAVASGKGGVGKTWFAVTLAHALARAGQRCLVIDGDLGLANVDIQIGLMPEADLGMVADGRRTAASAVTPHEAGFDVIAGRSGSGALATMAEPAFARMLASIAAVTADYDMVIIDLGAGLDHSVRRLARFADTLMLVITDEPTSLTNAYAVLKLYAAEGGDVAAARVVVNQSASPAAGSRTFATLARACKTFLGCEPTLAGLVRRDDHVRDAIRRQTPLLTRHPGAPAAMDVEAIAQDFA